MLVLPALFYFPDFIRWYGFGPALGKLAAVFVKKPWMGTELLVKQGSYRTIWLFLQLFLGAGLLSVLWRPELPKVSNKIADGLGGPPAAGRGQFGTSRWRTEKEIAKTLDLYFTDQNLSKGGVVVGAEKLDRKMKVYLESQDTHVLLLGATRSGKTRSVILPTVWCIGKTGESMVLTDPKGELFEKSSGYLKNQGYEVILLDLRETLRGNRWNVMEPVVRAAGEGRDDKAVEASLDIAHAIVYQKAHNSDPIWELGEKAIVAGLILSVAYEAADISQKHMYSVAMMLARLAVFDEDGYCPLNEYVTGLGMLHPARGAFSTALMASPKTRASFFAGAMAKLQLFTDPNIAAMTAMQDHNLTAIGARPTAVFLVIPDEKSTRYLLASLYINQVYQALVELALENGGRVKNRVHFLLDEFGNLPPIPDMDKKITVAGGRGMKFTLALQGLSQLKPLYGERSQTITGNCHTWLYLSTTDPDTARVISEKTGKYTVQTESSNYNYSENRVGGSTGLGLTGRALLTPDEVERWPKGSSLVLQAREMPARLPLPDLSEWPADKELDGSYQGCYGINKMPDVQVWYPGLSFTEKLPEGGDEVACSKVTGENVQNILEQL
ncbi:VirD4-like conjugal transfer protein, CD1115 family [Zhaonella formicivorans]|uniref:VirD4-like conjugal transfer protein, CD1115 family n=1 Tax=Zhaonella formicivorans TaxID=2528593 RepID=UPI001D115865|nr:type IV secretory system conjugative DNA transfer family protein [Zhaonella formicivorans]